MIKNNTPYIGKIRLKFEKYPHYTGSSYLNKIHLDLGFTKLVSRITPKRNKEYGYEIDQNKVNLIEQYTGGFIGTHKWEDTEVRKLPNSFLTGSGKYVGDIRTAWWHYQNNFVICENYPHGVAIKYKEDRYKNDDLYDDDIEGFYGYSHRGGSLFKIGDRLFNSEYEPKEEDYPEWMWSGFVEKYNKSYESSDDFDKKYIYNKGVKSIIPFNLRGNKDIENWDDALQAATNMSKYLG
jgi:hypothetical protein